MRIELGSERLAGWSRLAGLRVGVVCNPASVDHAFTHVVDRLAATPGVRIGAIFGPQHGFRSDVQENMIETGHGRDLVRRVPVYSLYSETREPTAEMLEAWANEGLTVDELEMMRRRYCDLLSAAQGESRE